MAEGNPQNLNNDWNSLDKKIEKVWQDLKNMNYILIASVIVILVMVATLIIDSFHINSATYKEYSEKVQTLNSLKTSNYELLDQNKKNQELILNQQNQLIELINKLKK